MSTRRATDARQTPALRCAGKRGRVDAGVYRVQIGFVVGRSGFLGRSLHLHIPFFLATSSSPPPGLWDARVFAHGSPQTAHTMGMEEQSTRFIRNAATQRSASASLTGAGRCWTSAAAARHMSSCRPKRGERAGTFGAAQIIFLYYFALLNFCTILRFYKNSARFYYPPRRRFGYTEAIKPMEG